MPRQEAFLLPFLTLLALTANAQTAPPVTLQANYETYAAGVPIADVESELSLGPRNYRLTLGYQTTGVVGFFFRGHQSNLVTGTWHGLQASPLRFTGEGSWRGADRRADIDYQDGKPAIRQLVPANDAEREPVPEALQANTIDTLSALAELIKVVDATGRCETTVHTYDGRRAVEITAHTAGEETLDPTTRSSFAGKALRCDFAGRMLAGFMFGDDRERDSRPMHGSAWLAPLAPGGPKLPVRMAFETRWFGEATMYLTATGPTADLKLARGK
jgi:hypothetical protein